MRGRCIFVITKRGGRCSKPTRKQVRTRQWFSVGFFSKPNPRESMQQRPKSAKIYAFSRGIQKNLNQAGRSSRTICYGEDFFFKYSSIVNACGNGGKPLPCLQRRGSSLWTLSGRTHLVLRMHCVWIFIHSLDSTPFEYSCT